MQVKLTEERIQQIEKELGVNQVKANDEYNEYFHILGAAKRGLLNNKTKQKPIQYTIVEGGHWFNWNDRNNTKVAHSIKFEDGSIFDMVNGWRQLVTIIGSCKGCGIKFTNTEEAINHVRSCAKIHEQSRLETKSETGIKCRDCWRVFTGTMKEFLEHECNPKSVPCYPGQNQEQKANSSLTAMEELASMGYKKSAAVCIVPRILLENILASIEAQTKANRERNNDFQSPVNGPSNSEWIICIQILKAALAIEKGELKTPLDRSQEFQLRCSICGGIGATKDFIIHHISCPERTK